MKDKTLDEKMKEAGMLSIEDMLKPRPLDGFMSHAGVTDLDKFEEWLVMRVKEFMTEQARFTVDKNEDDEMFEWYLSHNAAFKEVLVNFRQAKLTTNKEEG